MQVFGDVPESVQHFIKVGKDLLDQQVNLFESAVYISEIKDLSYSEILTSFDGTTPRAESLESLV